MMKKTMRLMQNWRPARLFLRPAARQGSDDGIGAALAEWASWCEAHPRSTCELALSGHWLIACAADEDEALRQWDHYLGLDAGALARSWVLRFVQGLPGKLGCGAPRALIDGLSQAAEAHKVSLRWVGPWWALPAQQWLADAGDDTALQASEPGLLTCFRRERDSAGRWALSQAWREVGDAPTLALAEAAPSPAPLVAVTALAAGALPDALLAEMPEPDGAPWRVGWADGLDFVGPRVRVAPWSWALLVAGMAACMAVSEQAQGSLAARDEAQAMVKRLERARHQHDLAQAAPRAASAPGQQPARVLDDNGWRQAARVAQQLAYPWPAVIERVEQAARQEHAVLTGFSLDTGSLGGKGDARPQLRLQAAVRDDASALRWAAAHGEGAQMVGRDVLAVPFDSEQGHHALRAEATWAAGEATP